jgi:hypothetical protein
MKRLTLGLAACLTCMAVTLAYAGDYHIAGSLKCPQCHVSHGQQQHSYLPAQAHTTEIGAGAPYGNLLRNKVNDLCLSCHDTRIDGHNSDVFCGTTVAEVRQGGALNIADGAASEWTNETDYSQTDGHSLYSTDVAPGGTWRNPEGLNCADCHMPHGHVATQYRNLWTSEQSGDKFFHKTITYQQGGATIDKSKDVYETARLGQKVEEVWFNEPFQTTSAYAEWCKSCHTNFHGTSGGSEVGGQSGGWTFGSPGWKRHPNADVNIGHLANADYVSSLTRYQGLTNKVKVMSNSATTVAAWATATDVTPSCFSCHKGHGNKNGFGLIMMAGTGTVSEEGDATGLNAYIDSNPDRIMAPTPLCQQCHIQGVAPAVP